MTSTAPVGRALRGVPGVGPPGHLRRAQPNEPIRPLAFLGVAIVSFGGPLALAALYAPTIVTDASASAGLVNVSAAVVFGVPLLVWLRYSRHVATSGGLYGFVEAAAGRRVALAQAALWTASYLLYLLYTTASIVYDILPVVLPGVGPYQPLVEVALPLVLAAVMLAGRAFTLAVTGLLAVVQMLLVAALALVTLRQGGPAVTSGVPAPVGAIGAATAQTALLYVCGSLPLFLGGELATPARTVRRGLLGGYLLVAAGVVATVAPLAANPAFTRAPIPGVSVARVFAGPGLAVAVGLGVAASVAGVMLVEFLALSRLLHAVTRRPTGSIIGVLAVLLVAAGPVSLVNPEAFYNALLKPSLVALWLSQLVVFAVYPRFAVRHGGNRIRDAALALGACGFAVYGIYAAVQHAAT
jgi:amino acid transporter